MKNSILIIAAIVCVNLATAQTIQVTEQKATFSTGEQNALITTIFKNTLNEVVDKWKNYLKDFKNEKVKFDNNEMFGDNVLVKEWGNNPVDVYTRFEENKADNTVRMMVAFDLGGAYLSSGGDSAKYALAQKMIKDFAVKTTKFQIEEKLKNAQKLLEGLENDQKNLEKDNKDLHNEIENLKNKIAKTEDEIKKNVNSQEKKRAEVSTQKSAVDQVNRDLEAVK